MRLTVITVLFQVLIFCTLFGLYDQLYSELPRNHVQNTPLEDSLNELEKRYGINFVYVDALIRRKMPTPLPDKIDDLDKFLEKWLATCDLRFDKVDETTYVLIPAKFQTTGHGQLKATGTIRGVVMDSDGSALAGANIVILNMQIGTVSNTNGFYELKNAPLTAIDLQASYLGYKTVRKRLVLSTHKANIVNLSLQPDILKMDAMVTTTTRAVRMQKELPGSFTLLDAAEIRRMAPNSLADILQSVPGVHAEGGGGELSANVFVRGLPAPGQYKYNPVEEDGMPVISTSGITSIAPDIYFRYDLNVETLEFSRGGSSGLFGTGSPAGIINYKSKVGGPTPKSTLQMTYGERNLIRTDFNNNGPIGKHVRYNIGGYYRYDEGPIRTGLLGEGFQIKGNITRLFTNGFLRIFAKYVDDHAQFFLPFAHDSRTGRPAIGDDGNEIRTVNSAEAAEFSFLTPDGSFESRMENGIQTRGGSVMLQYTHRLGDSWTLEGKTRWADIDHESNLFIPFPAFQTVDGYANRHGVDGEPLFIQDPEAQRPIYTYTNHPEERFSGKFLIDQGAWYWHHPFTDIATDFSIARTFDGERVAQRIILGAFLSRTRMTQEEIHSSVLVEFADQPRLLDLMIQDRGPDGLFDTADDDTIAVTRNGLTNAVSSLGSVYNNNQLSNNKLALFAGNELVIAKRLRIDGALRYEWQTGTLVVEGAEPVTVAENPSLAEQGFQWGNGKFTRRTLAFNDWAASVGINYALTDQLNLYGIGSQGYFFPELQVFSGNIGRDAQGNFLQIEPDNESFLQMESGLKFSDPVLSGTVALHYTKIANRLQTDAQQGTDGVVRNITRAVGEAATLGLEMTAALAVPQIQGLVLSSDLTLQDHGYLDYSTRLPGDDGQFGTDDDIHAVFDGNRVPRQPQLMSNWQLLYEHQRFEVRASLKYLGERFADDANEQALDAFTVYNLDAGYKLKLRNSTVRLGINIYNLLNSRGLTEGDPRIPPGVSLGERPYFNARPVLPRRILGRLTIDL